jgi:hypothetical protein
MRPLLNLTLPSLHTLPGEISSKATWPRHRPRAAVPLGTEEVTITQRRLRRVDLPRVLDLVVAVKT